MKSSTALSCFFLLFIVQITAQQFTNDDDEDTSSRPSSASSMASSNLVDNTTTILRMKTLPKVWEKTVILNTTDAASVLSRFILSCDGMDHPSFVVYVRISRNNEDIVEGRLWHDGATEGESTTESRIEYRKTCTDLFDECFMSKYFRYGVSPGLEGAKLMYTGRLAFRVDDPHGEWVLDVVGALPHDGIVHVQVVIEQLDLSMTSMLVIGACVFLLSVGVVLLGWGYMRSRRPRVISAPDPAAVTDEGTTQTDGSVMQSYFQRMRTYAEGFHPVFMYRRLRNNGTLREVPTHTETSNNNEEENVAVSAATAEEEDDSDRICRICRSTAPAEDLFAPCRCNGTMKYIHRACLEQWRDVTTNPQNKLRCSECHAKFMIVEKENTFGFLGHLGKHAGWYIAAAFVMEITLLLLGYVFKTVVLLLTWRPAYIDWSPVNFYHHFVGALIITTVVHNVTFVIDPVCNALNLTNWSRAHRRILVIASLFLNIPLGYFVKYVVWAFSSTPWDDRISYGYGFIGVVVAVMYVCPVLQRMHARWAQRNRSQQVVEPQGLTIRDDDGEEMQTV